MKGGWPGKLSMWRDFGYHLLYRVALFRCLQASILTLSSISFFNSLAACFCHFSFEVDDMPYSQVAAWHITELSLKYQYFPQFCLPLRFMSVLVLNIDATGSIHDRLLHAG